LYDTWGEFGCIKQLQIAKLDLIGINFGHFECINFTRMLVNNVDNILQESIEGFALEIEGDQISGIVSVSFEKFLK
jgi:hypothetical protein